MFGETKVSWTDKSSFKPRLFWFKFILGLNSIQLIFKLCYWMLNKWVLNKDFEPWMKLNNNKYNVIRQIFFFFLFFFFAIFALLICTHKNIFWNYFSIFFFLEVFTVFLILTRWTLTANLFCALDNSGYSGCWLKEFQFILYLIFHFGPGN